MLSPLQFRHCISHMPLYEVLCVAKAGADAPALANVFKRVSALVLEAGGVVRGVDHLGVRSLAYRIRAGQQKVDIGRYILLRMQANPDTKARVENTLRSHDEIVRFLTTKHKVAPWKPSQPPPAVVNRATAAVDPMNAAMLDTVRRMFPGLDSAALNQMVQDDNLSPDQLLQLVRGKIPADIGKLPPKDPDRSELRKVLDDSLPL